MEAFVGGKPVVGLHYEDFARLDPQGWRIVLTQAGAQLVSGDSFHARSPPSSLHRGVCRDDSTVSSSGVRGGGFQAPGASAGGLLGRGGGDRGAGARASDWQMHEGSYLWSKPSGTTP